MQGKLSTLVKGVSRGRASKRNGRGGRGRRGARGKRINRGESVNRDSNRVSDDDDD